MVPSVLTPGECPEQGSALKKPGLRLWCQCLTKKEENLHHRAEGKGSAGEEKERGAKTGVRRRFYLLHASAMQVRRTPESSEREHKNRGMGERFCEGAWLDLPPPLLEAMIEQ